MNSSTRDFEQGGFSREMHHNEFVSTFLNLEMPFVPFFNKFSKGVIYGEKRFVLWELLLKRYVASFAHG